MAQGDNLADLLAIARRDMPDVPAAVWERFAALAALNFPATRLYIASAKKRRHLDALAASDAAADTATLARMLNLSEARVRQLKKLI
jgi:hypothetical protein